MKTYLIIKTTVLFSLAFLFCYGSSAFEFPSKVEKSGYVTENFLPEVHVPELLDVIFIPNKPNALVLPSKTGQVFIVNDTNNPEMELLFDLSDKVSIFSESGLNDVIFHPAFPDDPRIFITYRGLYDTGTGLRDHNILSQIIVENLDPLSVDISTEQIMIAQLDIHPEHNAGDLEFGPDGFLYISMGDGGGNNYWTNAQRIDLNYFSAIARIDVNNLPESLEPNPHKAFLGGYKIPNDNPFIGIESFNGAVIDPNNVRTEFFAVGFRNPWRISFDFETGDLYAMDVGPSRFEEINLVLSGGNYGWYYLEGMTPHAGDSSRVVLSNPLFYYQHSSNRSAVTGGIFYRGSKLPELSNSFVFCDFGGAIGYLRHENGILFDQTYIAHEPGSVSMRVHPDGETILIADLIEGTVQSLEYYGRAVEQFPEKLSELGLFKDLTDLAPINEMLPYTINLPFWSDYAIKSRFVLHGSNEPVELNSSNLLEFPTQTIWVKHFDFEKERGNLDSKIRLETRIMVKSDDGIYGLTYIWDNDQKDARLAKADGEELNMTVLEDGKARKQKWTFPSRNACLDCHTEVGGYALGFQPHQLNNKDNFVTLPNRTESLLSKDFKISKTALNFIKESAPLVKLEDERFPLETRVRSYLSANCSQCHAPGGPTRATWDARFSVPLHEMNFVDVPAVSNVPIPEPPKIVDPGSLYAGDSILLLRLNSDGQYRMPPLGSNEIDHKALQLVKDWIVSEQLIHYQSYESWSSYAFSTAIEIEQTQAASDPDLDGKPNVIEYLNSTNPLYAEVIDQDGLYISYGAQSVEIKFYTSASKVKSLLTTKNLEKQEEWQSASQYWHAVRDLPNDWKEVKYVIPLKDAQRFFKLD